MYKLIIISIKIKKIELIYFWSENFIQVCRYVYLFIW